MSIYVWFEASKSGYDFWKCLFDVIYPDIAIETDKSKVGSCFIKGCYE